MHVYQKKNCKVHITQYGKKKTSKLKTIHNYISYTKTSRHTLTYTYKLKRHLPPKITHLEKVNNAVMNNNPVGFREPSKNEADGIHPLDHFACGDVAIPAKESSICHVLRLYFLTYNNYLSIFRSLHTNR